MLESLADISVTMAESRHYLLFRHQYIVHPESLPSTLASLLSLYRVWFRTWVWGAHARRAVLLVLVMCLEVLFGFLDTISLHPGNHFFAQARWRRFPISTSLKTARLWVAASLDYCLTGSRTSIIARCPWIGRTCSGDMRRQYRYIRGPHKTLVESCSIVKTRYKLFISLSHWNRHLFPYTNLLFAFDSCYHFYN